MGYKLGKKSLNNLKGVDESLVSVVKRAIEITTIDFSVIEGKRTVERQRMLVDTGASRTMNSAHIVGEAVDLAAYVEGGISWHWGHYYVIAKAMRDAARELDIKIIWGGCWQCLNWQDDIRQSVTDYILRKEKQGKKAFLDGPHFQVE